MTRKSVDLSTKETLDLLMLLNVACTALSDVLNIEKEDQDFIRTSKELLSTGMNLKEKIQNYFDPEK